MFKKALPILSGPEEANLLREGALGLFSSAIADLTKANEILTNHASSNRALAEHMLTEADEADATVVENGKAIEQLSRFVPGQP